MLWNTSTNLNDLKSTYTDTSPVDAIKGVSYSSLSVDSDYRFDERYDEVGYKFSGFFRPPFSGYFHVMTKSDDASEILISNNGDPNSLVSDQYNLFFLL